ncbi:TetR/AcrR family transcriptional regulator [Niallia circulans]|uniref:TetR/AcrR family transcriptional regulator n=1 Tax=Niallia circulans TaxID=1397 RepID=UPI001561360A|nr:TetR/AcrR family transcriptional regulator [Niallia circulans]NRG33074.1 TetR/AcrR family transcriptional regulator [Niallia circulans]
MSGKIDRRIQRTKRDIRMAFIKLIRENNAKDLTVKEITSLANYNRTTFYTHYSDKDELIEDIIENAIQEFINMIDLTFRDGEVPHSIKLSSKTSKSLFKYIEDNKPMFSLLFNVNKFPSFQEKLCSALTELLKYDTHLIKQFNNELDCSLYCYTQSAALIGRINFWIKEGYTFNADYMAEQMVEYLKLFKQ